MERFQFAYGWLTQWSKTVAYVLQPEDDPPPRIFLPSVTNRPGVHPWKMTFHTVPVIKDELEMLRTKVDDPTARFSEIDNFFKDLSIPRFSM